MNTKQKGLLLWAAAPIGAYLLSSKGLVFSLIAAAGFSYAAYKMVLSNRERETLERVARDAGYVTDLSRAITG